MSKKPIIVISKRGILYRFFKYKGNKIEVRDGEGYGVYEFHSHNLTRGVCENYIKLLEWKNVEKNK